MFVTNLFMIKIRVANIYWPYLYAWHIFMEIVSFNLFKNSKVDTVIPPLFRLLNRGFHWLDFLTKIIQLWSWNWSPMSPAAALSSYQHARWFSLWSSVHPGNVVGWWQVYWMITREQKANHVALPKTDNFLNWSIVDVQYYIT